MYIGADYYPEHWPRERWTTDAKLMKEAGFNIVRMAEFAWVKMEPVEGLYDFSWLDEAIEILGDAGVKTILGTPTGSMPAWVALKYPEVVAVDKTGHKIPYGNRKDNCPTSLSYRMLGQKIVRAMAEHFAQNENVIGWQTDNELGGPNCYCDTCKIEWQEWLEKKYITIDELNERWGTVFWSHTYRDFNQVPLPKRGSSNPSLELDYCRFHSTKVVSFQKEHIEILREICKGKFITHNFMGFYDNIDYYNLAEDLDFVSWDYYYNGSWGNTGSWKDRYSRYNSGAAANDLMRSLKNKNFWIMENSAGPLGWECYGRNLRPGEFKHMSLQNAAHGADGQIWFRWRTSRFGTEQYWHGILGHDGIPGRRYKEASEIGVILQKLSPYINGSETIAKVAIMLSYEDRWALKIQKNANNFDFDKHIMKYYKAFSKLGVDVDFVRPNGDLSKYKLVIMPTVYIVTEEIAKNAKSFVENGGTLITTFRTGVKDSSNVPHALTLPGLLREITGIRVEEYESIDPDNCYEVEMDNSTYTAEILSDWIIPESAQVIAKYKHKDLSEYAVLTVNNFGSGRVYYVGTSFIEDKAYDKLVELALKGSGIKTFGPLPEGVEITTRTKDDYSCYFLINHTDETVSVEVPTGMELISEKEISGTINLGTRDVIVVKCEN